MLANSKGTFNSTWWSQLITLKTTTKYSFAKLDEPNDAELLAQSLEKLRHVLTKVNDAVAFYQNTNEFKKLLDNIDPKSSTNILYKIDKQIEQKKFTVILISETCH